jgi:hypothetical protein
VSSRGFSGRKETMTGGLELRLTGIERRRQGSSVVDENGGRREAFDRCGRDKNGPTWGHGRSIWPSVVSRLGRDGAVRRMVHEAYVGRLTGGDLGWFK